MVKKWIKRFAMMTVPFVSIMSFLLPMSSTAATVSPPMNQQKPAPQQKPNGQFLIQVQKDDTTYYLANVTSNQYKEWAKKYDPNFLEPYNGLKKKENNPTDDPSKK